MTSITLTRPDDWHIHLRDGATLTRTVADASQVFNRAVIMPNLTPPVVNLAQANAYQDRIMAEVPEGRQFTPLMTLYLTDATTPKTIREAKAGGILAAKLYPAGATTNSDSGVTGLDKIADALQAMQEVGMLLLVHGEVTDHELDIFDREKTFIDQRLGKIVADYPNLKVVLEHITTKDAVEFVMAQGNNVAATITPQHLLYNRNHMLVGAIRPHYFCLPILKRGEHQQALIEAAISGNSKFFLGTDSAPHAQHKKENDCGCAGCYSANCAIELYAEAFDAAGALDKLEGFASHFGPDFYGLPRNTDSITLTKESWTCPDTLDFGGEPLVPLRAGADVLFKVV